MGSELPEEVDFEASDERVMDAQRRQLTARTHGENLRRGAGAGYWGPQLIDKVVESELEHTDGEGGALENLRAQDFPLSFYTEGEGPVEFKWQSEIIDMFDKARYPHPQSGLQGLARAWATGDTSDRKSARELDEIVTDESYKMGTYSRATRGEEGAQQEEFGRQVSEAHTYTDGTGQDGGGGLLSWLRRS